MFTPPLAASSNKEEAFNIAKLSNNYIWRIGAGNYQAEQFESENLAQICGELTFTAL